MSRASRKARRERGLTFDSGVLVALDRGDRRQWLQLMGAQRNGILPVVPAPVVTQVWRTSRQANLSRALKACEIEAVDGALARQAGELCAAARTRDVVDAIVVASAARRGSTIVTSDPVDIARLAACTTGADFRRL